MHGMIRIRIGLPSRQFALRSLPNPKIPLTLKILPILRTPPQAVTLINRMLDRAPDANHLLADMVRWPDNPETAWYYADIQEATNSHDYTRAGTGNYEVWTELLANRDWAALEEIWSQANDAPGGEVMG